MTELVVMAIHEEERGSSFLFSSFAVCTPLLKESLRSLTKLFFFFF